MNEIQMALLAMAAHCHGLVPDVFRIHAVAKGFPFATLTEAAEPMPQPLQMAVA